MTKMIVDDEFTEYMRRGPAGLRWWRRILHVDWIAWLGETRSRRGALFARLRLDLWIVGLVAGPEEGGGAGVMLGVGPVTVGWTRERAPLPTPTDRCEECNEYLTGSNMCMKCGHVNH